MFYAFSVFRDFKINNPIINNARPTGKLINADLVNPATIYVTKEIAAILFKKIGVDSSPYIGREMALSLLKEYDVDYIYVGEVEQGKYGDKCKDGVLDYNYLRSLGEVVYADEGNSEFLQTFIVKIDYEGKVIETFFFSTSNGYTENSEDVFVSEVPYLRGVESPYDNISPVFNYGVDYTYDIFCSLLGLKYSTDLKIEVLDKSIAGRIKKIKINEK